MPITSLELAWVKWAQRAAGVEGEADPHHLQQMIDARLAGCEVVVKWPAVAVGQPLTKAAAWVDEGLVAASSVKIGDTVDCKDVPIGAVGLDRDGDAVLRRSQNDGQKIRWRMGAAMSGHTEGWPVWGCRHWTIAALGVRVDDSQPRDMIVRAVINILEAMPNGGQRVS